MKHFFKKLYNYLYLIFTQDKELNFYFFQQRLEKEFPKGLMFIHEGIEFYVKDYSSLQDNINTLLESNQDKLYVVCEYFDLDNKQFKEKIMHEDFVRNRYKVFQGLSN